jgi:hypothetical protein
MLAKLLDRVPLMPFDPLLPRFPSAVLPARRYRFGLLSCLLFVLLAPAAHAQLEPPGTDPALNTLLVIGLGLSLIALVIVTLWIAWPLLHRSTEDDPC